MREFRRGRQQWLEFRTPAAQASERKPGTKESRRTHARTHARMHARMHARTHARMHARARAHTHTHTRTNIYIPARKERRTPWPPDP